MSEDIRIVARWARDLWKGSPVALALVVTFSLGSAMLLTAFPFLWQYVIDSAETGTSLWTLAGWLAALGVGHCALYIVLQGTRSIMNARLQWRARTRVLGHLSRLDESFYRRWRSGDLVTRLTDDAGEKMSWFLCSGLFRTWEAVLIVAVCVSAMAWIDVGLTAWILMPLPILLVAQSLLQDGLGRRYLAVQESISAINDELTSTFGGIRIVQACGLVPQARERFVDAIEEQRRAEVAVQRLQQGVFLLYGHGWQIALVALLLGGGLHVLDDQLTLGQFVAFEGLVTVLVWPMFDVGMFLSKYKQTATALRRLDALLAQDVGVDPLDDAPEHGGLVLDTARVVAEDGVVLLSDVALEVRPGEIVAVVGSVGSGKTTLVQALAGARATDGTRRVGLDVAVVPQDPVLLSATLRENILLGREGDLDAALRLSRLEQDLPALPEGLETWVGERGVTLSGGQQQRVALARALVGQPEVLLLDDATAALDADTEAAFWGQLEERIPHMATVVVTHRPATIRRADRVVVLDDGRLVQRGTHDELVAVDGAYRRIYGRIQARKRVG